MPSLTFYAPTFIDESMTLPDRHGSQQPTGRLSGMVMTRTFSTTKTGRIKAARGITSFSWENDSESAKVAALAMAINGMEELPELDQNPPINWIPDSIKERLT